MRVDRLQYLIDGVLEKLEQQRDTLQRLEREADGTTGAEARVAAARCEATRIRMRAEEAVLAEYQRALAETRGSA